MAMKIDRRAFLKTSAAMAVAVSMTGLLGGCSEEDLYGEAVGLGKTAELQGMQMRVDSLGTLYDSATGSFYMVPSVRLTNNGALPIDGRAGERQFQHHPAEPYRDGREPKYHEAHPREPDPVSAAGAGAHPQQNGKGRCLRLRQRCFQSGLCIRGLLPDCILPHHLSALQDLF